MNPSKELLSEVLPHGENTILKIEQEGHWVNIYYEIGGLTEINIYELVYKCKKWAWRQEKIYEIVERKTQVDVYRNGKKVAQFIGDSLIVFLPNRVFEACEWISEQKAKS